MCSGDLKFLNENPSYCLLLRSVELVVIFIYLNILLNNVIFINFDWHLTKGWRLSKVICHTWMCDITVLCQQQIMRDTLKFDKDGRSPYIDNGVLSASNKQRGISNVRFWHDKNFKYYISTIYVQNNYHNLTNKVLF